MLPEGEKKRSKDAVTYRVSINERNKIDREVAHNATQSAGFGHTFHGRTKPSRFDGGLGNRIPPASQGGAGVDLKYEFFLNGQNDSNFRPQ